MTRINPASEDAAILSVAIVEDDPRVRETVGEYISQVRGFRLAGAFPDGETALKELPGLNPDVVLMDIGLPGKSGIECVRALKAQKPDLTVVMFTVYDEGDFLFESLKAGASGYLLKRTPGAKLLESLREACLGGMPLTRHMAAKVGSYFQNLGKSQAELATLTAREREVLKLLADGLLYKQIAIHLGISMDTVRQYLRSIYNKLHVNSRTEAVVKFLGR